MDFAEITTYHVSHDLFYLRSIIQPNKFHAFRQLYYHLMETPHNLYKFFFLQNSGSQLKFIKQIICDLIIEDLETIQTQAT